jgi:hypothetical protein
MNTAASNSSADIGSVIFVLILIGISVALYMLPSIVGWRRHVVNIGSIVTVNLLLGWTLVGWVVALAMAARTNPTQLERQR